MTPTEQWLEDLYNIRLAERASNFANAKFQLLVYDRKVLTISLLLKKINVRQCFPETLKAILESTKEIALYVEGYDDFKTRVNEYIEEQENG